jgi:hypothetical protein
VVGATVDNVVTTVEVDKTTVVSGTVVAATLGGALSLTQPQAKTTKTNNKNDMPFIHLQNTPL